MKINKSRKKNSIHWFLVSFHVKMHPIQLPFYQHIQLFSYVHLILDYRKILRVKRKNFRLVEQYSLLVMMILLLIDWNQLEILMNRNRKNLKKKIFEIIHTYLFT